MRTLERHRTWRTGIAVALPALLLATVGGTAAWAQSSSAPAASDLVIGYATKSATNQGWIIINKGADDAALALGVKLVPLGPPTANEISGQLAVTEDLINQQVNALVIAPVDSTGIVPAVEKANA